MTRHIALGNCQDIGFNLKKNDGENVNIRIDCYFVRIWSINAPDVGLKIYREALARITEFYEMSLHNTNYFYYQY